MKNKQDSHPDIHLARMNSGHIEDVVDIHLVAFKNFFLSFLGENFLKVYYNAVLGHDNAIKIILIMNTEVIGFVVGSMNPTGFYSSLLKNNKYEFAMASIPAIIKRPSCLPKIIRSFSKPKQANQEIHTSELTSLAVLPQYQRYGYGRFLVNEFINQCKERSGKKITLTTDAVNNDIVNNFYTKAGFVLVRSFTTPEKRLMNEYDYIIS